MRQTAKVLGRAPSTISREVRRNFCCAGVPSYRAFVAHHRATERARRPRSSSWEGHPHPARRVERWLHKGWSPGQIAARLRKEHPHDPRWWMSHEAIYRALYVQGRGGLRKELTRHLRRGRAQWRSGPEPKGRFHDMVMLTERPPEADDRAVPGQWEGDLLLGAGCRSQVGMLAERTTRLTLLFALPHDRSAATVSAALADVIETLPSHLARLPHLGPGQGDGQARPGSLSTLASRSTSVTREVPGSEARRRTPPVSSASCRRRRISRGSPRLISQRSPGSSMVDHARHWIGRHPRRPMLDSSALQQPG